MLRPHFLIGCFAFVSCFHGVDAEVRLAGVFGDGMVLQREMPVPIWGWADPGERIIVEFSGQKVSTLADADGYWQIKLAPMPASSIGRDLKAGNQSIHDVLVGEVWLCAGQSNMEWPLERVEDIENDGLLNLRVATTPKQASNYPLKDVQLRWRDCRGKPADFSAVGYYFGRELEEHLNVPVGVINSSWGGTHIEAWISPEGYSLFSENSEELRSIHESLQIYVPGTLAFREHQSELYIQTRQAVEDWLRQPYDAGIENKPMPFIENLPAEAKGNVRFQAPSRIFYGRIYPLIPMSLRGIIWYQGESNGREGMEYADKMEALVEGWRQLWGYDFSFYYVQLPNFRSPPSGPGDDAGWPRLREAQLDALRISDTGMIVTIDIGDPYQIHPSNKLEVARRLSLWARVCDYGEREIVCSGPLYRSHEIRGDSVEVSFDYIGEGLMVGKLSNGVVVPDDNTSLKQFSISGDDGQWHWAQAEIRGDNVIVWSPDVPNPIAVRYAFSMNPENANLYNRNGLPASPFRTDDQ